MMINGIWVRFIVGIFAITPLLAQAVPVDVNADGEVGPEEVIDLAENWKGLALTSSGLQPWQIDGATIFYNTGKVGIGTGVPHHQLGISGGPPWTLDEWIGALELEEAAAIGWQGVAGSQRFGIGYSYGGLHFFHTDGDPGTATSEAHYAMTITDAGLVGIGTTIPDTELHVADGRIRVCDTATGNRWDMFQTNNGDLFKIEQNAAFSNFAIVGGAEGRVGIGTDSPVANTKLHVLNNKLNSFGVYSEAYGSMASAIYGKTNIGYGVYGIADSGYGVYGVTPGGIGVAGRSNTNYGVEGTSIDSWGVSGVSTNSIGVSGSSLNGIGVDGYSGGGFGAPSAGIGVKGTGTYGVFASSTNPEGSGLLVFDGAQFLGSDVVFMGGNLRVVGEIDEGKSTVRMDHPLDPENKILSHSSVESPDMMNLYNGNLTLDDQGEAEVTLPEWFMALNKDFRYQLTPIGAPGANLHVAQEIVDGRFRIGGGSPGLKVSWQVTGVRQDAYAKAHPIEVEKVKTEIERGKYLDPEVFGLPKEKGIHYRPETQVSAGSEPKVE